MKKIILSIIMLAGLMVGANAQNNNENGNFRGQQRPDPEQMAQMFAQRVAEALSLSDAEAEQFMPMYIEYSKEFRAINRQYHGQRIKPELMSDADVDLQIRNNFKKSRAILDLREAWYEKFLIVLSPRQLQKMYEQENNMGRAASEMHSQRGGQHGQHGSQYGGHRGQGGQDRPSVQPKTKAE